MSDSDDDWFSKDIDEIVQKVQLKKQQNLPVSSVTIEDEQSTENLRPLPTPFLFEDYGGNYEVPKRLEEKTKQTLSKKLHKSNKTGGNYQQTISYKKLNFISELESALNIFLEVQQNDCGYFETFSDTNLSDEYITLIIKIYSKLLELPMHEFKYDFINFFINSNQFLNHLLHLIKNIFENSSIKNKKSIFQVNINELLGEIYSIIKIIEMHHLENDIIDSFLKKLLDILSTNGGSKYNGIILKLNQMYVNIKADKGIKFQDICPSLKELTINESNVGSLKPNITEGKYESVQHYLDIHTNLLREDFIIPLREAVQEIKKSKDIEKTSVSLKIYKKVRFIFNNDSLIYPSRKGEMILVDLKANQRDGQIVLTSTSNNSTTSPDASNWINPKKLMFGSLLCFTTNKNFDNLVLAVVSNRDVEMMIKGYIQVEIIQMHNVVNIYNETFIMFESEVYFEPYNHVYKVLRNLHETNFPMANNIVNIDKFPHLPGYLSSNRKSFYEYRKFSFNPTDYSSFPSAKAMKLNESQLNAYQHALSNKFTLIQGPPGTGKTYIGLKILTTLLMNVDSQILVICYTNHALDQFLQGIIHVTDSIVRMGNQSKNDQLDKFNIKQMNETVNTDRRLKACFHNIKKDYMKHFQAFEQLQRDYRNSDSKDLDDTYRKILENQQELRSISKKLDELKQITEYNAIKDKRIIGMTTTFAARCNFLLQLLNTPIVIIEEAAEVLESHIVASLTKNIQHLILIGDHKQLKPTTSVYQLSQKFKMDVSLFERMINNNVNCICLDTQQRMHPSIANLIRPIIYENLKDHELVTKYKKINGVSKNLFFVKHNSKESKFTDESTKKNIYEAQYLCALANYLLMQNYKPHDIVILTTYNGQMIQLLNERKQYPSLQKVKVAVVDNFQGEESKIILLSLVRSNDENNIGYLALQNRICVALTRAREGLYCIGNIEFLAKCSHIWKKIYEKLVEDNSVGNILPLQCERHDVVIEIKSLADFENVRFGGCQERCDIELQCGHKCGYMCHRSAVEHFADCNCEE